MRPIVYIALAAIALTALSACNKDNDSDYWSDYADWREANVEWVNTQAARTNPDGTPYYTRLVPVWDPEAYVLIHYFNDRALTAGNLSPIYTSTVAVKYRGELSNGTPFDSSYLKTDSVLKTRCNNVIEGWTIALEDMRVGDTCEVVIPYQQAYGAKKMDVILPYSALKFNMKLVDIPAYEIR